MQYNFRQLYASVMRDWLCLSKAQTDTVFGSAFTRLPIFKAQSTLSNQEVGLKGQYFMGEARLTYTVQDNYKYSSFKIEFLMNGIDFKDMKTYINTSLNSFESYFYTEANRADRMYYRVAAKDV